MVDSRNTGQMAAGQKGCKLGAGGMQTGGMHAGQEGYRKGCMQDRWECRDAGKERCRTGGMLKWSYKRKEGCRKWRIQDRRKHERRDEVQV